MSQVKKLGYIPFDPAGVRTWAEMVKLDNTLTKSQRDFARWVSERANGATKQERILQLEWFMGGAQPVLAEVDAMAKAISLGTAGAGGNISSFQVEQLDTAIVTSLTTHADFKLGQYLYKTGATNDRFQFTRRRRTGSRRGSGGFPNGGSPAERSPLYTREEKIVKYYGARSSYKFGDLVASNNGGTQTPILTDNIMTTTDDLMKSEEVQYLWENSAIPYSDGTTGTKYKGIVQQVTESAPKNIIDMRGQPLTIEIIQALAARLKGIGNVGSLAMHRFFLPYQVQESVLQSYIAKERVMIDRRSVAAGSISAGSNVGEVYSVDGEILSLETYKFWAQVGDSDIPGSEMRPVDYYQNVNEDGAPTAVPTNIVITPTNGGSGNLAAAFYIYHISFYNEVGETICANSSNVTIAAGQKAVMTLNRANGVAGVRIYRETVASSGATGTPALGWLIADIGMVASGSVAFTDDGEIIEGTYWAYILSQNPEDLVIAQMLDMLKMDLPQIDTTFPWLLLHFYTPVVKIPERQLIIKNIGAPNLAPAFNF